MLDLNHLALPTTGRTELYFGKSSTLGGTWEIWEKPRGINMVHITCIGDGGGGGGGVSNAGNRGGGAGGSSGGFTCLSIPAVFLPDRLYVSVGSGGRGGGPGNPAILGTAGVGSYVAIAPYTTLTGIYTVCYANGGTVSATAPTQAATSSAPGAVAAATITNMLIAGLGNFSALAGQVGGAGGITGGGAGGAITYPATGLLLSGGGGGGGGAGAFNGGSVNAPVQASYVYFSTLAGGASGNPTASDGASGYQIQQPLLSLGASGGGAGSVGAANGGNGRPGGIGSGGSGGGAGTIGGTGGHGGPGLVIIQSW
jgi:hypothetical protein